ncbi:DUF4105 domain-containing protein [Lacinutrix sp. Hel_I_90]|uniref:lipoprotein N-acyltransferase Lnb domain-containing protein n=1 Tax=Lacinutrix sp. Hel_I_90 TaxID=1249999 RepID=UPI0005C98DCB|nr:DUF4105 domain-containing protein [Lacinutrix sp. Hel_I_90]
MKPFLLLLAFLLLFSISATAQNPNLSEDAEISVLTMGPGQLLNDSFGHSAFRVRTGTLDIVYNYGMFDFNAPNFYLNFAKGKLDYYLGYTSYERFKAIYISQNRSIKEQVLNLTKAQKRALFSFLINNAKEENKIYAYDFFYDNCATKMRDVAEAVLNSNIAYKTPKTYKAESFRQLINTNIYWNSWGHFGINVALGSVIDQKAEPRNYMFLPDYIFQFFDKASFKDSGEPLVKETNTIYESKPEITKSNFFLSPLFIIGLIGLCILWVTYLDYKKQTRSKWLDVSIFALTGSIGTLLFLLWFATDHTATANNYNVLWAFPLNLIISYQATKTAPKLWYIGFLKLLIILLCLMTLHWIIGVQGFSFALIPFLIALLFRYLYLLWFYKTSFSLQ